MRRRDALRAGAATLLLPAVDRAGATEPFEPLGRLSVPGAKELVVDDDVAYVATTDGFATVDTSDPAEPTLLAERRSLLADRPDGPMAGVQDGKLHGDRYAVAGPANPLDDVPRAAVVFDVSDPAAPERVLVHETPFYNHNVDLDDETIYLCGNDGDRNPLVCVDLGTGETVGRWSVVDADDRWADVDPNLRQLHDVTVVDGVAYCSYLEAGTWLVDVSDPADPTAVTGLRGRDPEALADVDSRAELREATFSLPGNDHSATPRGPGDPVLALNEEAWATDPEASASAVGGVELWDHAAGERLARIEAPPTDDPTLDGTWTTAHNFEFAGDRLYTSWYRGGVRVHDVSEPTAPRELGGWRDETTEFWTARSAGDHVVASGWRDLSADDPEAAAAVYTFPTVASSSTPAEATDETGMTDETVTDTAETTADGAGLGLAAGAAGLGLTALARRLRD